LEKNLKEGLMRKSSRYVPLYLIGTLLMVACSDQSGSNSVKLTQQAYAKQEDCVADWGDDESFCQPKEQTRQGSSYIRYFGPRYYWDHDRGYPVEVTKEGGQRPLAGVSRANGITKNGSTRAIESSSANFYKPSRGVFNGQQPLRVMRASEFLSTHRVSSTRRGGFGSRFGGFSRSGGG
jgi:hypothetical protein